MRVYLRNLIAGFVAVLLCVVALGMVYPAAVWAISRITPQSADGNLIYQGECLVGSTQIQDGVSEGPYFFPRAEGMSNYGTSSTELEKNIQERRAAIAQREGMVTGDNPLTAAAIAKEAGVDDYIAEATPEDKLARIREEQAQGRMVAMTGDGTNDAPALAQADVGVAMNTGTSAAKEAANMVDLDSDPTKLIDVVRIGKQLLITRGALTTFSLANDLAKYFAILPALFSAQLPHLERLNIMHLHSPESAIVSAVVFNALIIVALIPLALKGVSYKPASASSLLRRNLGIWGLGGVITPFIGIWLIDQVVSLLLGL